MQPDCHIVGGSTVDAEAANIGGLGFASMGTIQLLSSYNGYEALVLQFELPHKILFPVKIQGR